MSAAKSKAVPDWVVIMIRRLPYRSATAPAIGEISTPGANCRAVTMPRAMAEWSVSWVSTNQSWATRAIQVPTLEVSEPANSSR